MKVKKVNGKQELLTAAQVAELLPSTTSQTVLRWARRGDIPYVELPGGRKFFRRSDVEAVLTPVVGSAASSDELEAGQ